MFAQGTHGPRDKVLIRSGARYEADTTLTEDLSHSTPPLKQTRKKKKKNHKKTPRPQKLKKKPILCQTCCSGMEPFAHLMPEVTIHPACPLQPTTKSWQAAPQLCFCTFQHYSAPSCNHLLLIFPGCPV